MALPQATIEAVNATIASMNIRISELVAITSQMQSIIGLQNAVIDDMIAADPAEATTLTLPAFITKAQAKALGHAQDLVTLLTP